MFIAKWRPQSAKNFMLLILKNLSNFWALKPRQRLTYFETHSPISVYFTFLVHFLKVWFYEVLRGISSFWGTFSPAP